MSGGETAYMPSPMSADRLNKIRFRAWRRGFREADLILGPFADRNLAAMDGAELDAFEALLAEHDHDLYAWISGQPAPDAPRRPDAGTAAGLPA